MKAMSQRVAKAIVIMMVVQSVMLHNVSHARAVEISDAASDEAGALSLLDGKVGQSYEFYLRTEGGLPPLTWRVIEGELPPGLTLEESGKLKGVPTASRREAYSFVVEVSDSSQPSQQAKQPCLLRIAAAPLRVIGGSGKMKIAPHAPAVRHGSDSGTGRDSLGAAFESGEKRAETPAANQEQGFTWPVVAPKPARVYNASIADASAGSARTDAAANDLNPASFIQIYEVPKARGRNLRSGVSGRDDFEIYGKLIYDGHTEGLNSTRLTADETSTIVVKPNVSGRDIAFNTIYMFAELSSGDTKQNLEVINYSEVGAAPSADAFVIGASFETAKNILDKMITLQRRATDILRYVLGNPANRELTPAQLITLIEIDNDPNAATLRRRAMQAFEQYAPEIESISSFLVTEANRNIVERVANNLFHMDRDTFIAIAKQFSADAGLVKSQDPPTRDGAIRRLLSRTVQVYKDFTPARAEILAMSESITRGPSDTPERGKMVDNLIQLQGRIASFNEGDPLRDGLELEAMKVARDIYAYDRSVEAITNLRQTKFPNGWVSLEEARAKDGDTLKLTVRLQNPANAGTGNKVPFYIAVKKYGVKLHWASSFMFIKRTGLTEADLMPDEEGNTLSEVNFAPSPGVSYGITYFKRGDTGGSKFLRALAPTVGINVSFMNFKDPGFDLQSGMFTNTTGTDVQVGTGPIISFFNNKLHFIPVGWNLNADRKRRYWGVGFGFVEFAKELGKYLKSTGSGSTQ